MKERSCLDWVAKLVRVPSQHTKVAGSISGQGTYKKQPMNARTIDLSLSLSLSPLPPASDLSLTKISFKKEWKELYKSNRPLLDSLGNNTHCLNL